MDEVASQLKPFRELLDMNTRMTESINRWKLSLWSNGSGGPPGYLEIAREEDKIREEKRDHQTSEIMMEMKELRDKFLVRSGEEIGKGKLEQKNREHSKSWVEKWGLAAAIISAIIGFLGMLIALGVLIVDMKIKVGEINPKIGHSYPTNMEYDALKRPPQTALDSTLR
jgi:hypothetical protein